MKRKRRTIYLSDEEIAAINAYWRHAYPRVYGMDDSGWRLGLRKIAADLIEAKARLKVLNETPSDRL